MNLFLIFRGGDFPENFDPKIGKSENSLTPPLVSNPTLSKGGVNEFYLSDPDR